MQLDHSVQDQATLDEVTKLGMAYYLEELRDELEVKYLNKYAVIEPFSKEYFIDADLLEAIEQAERKFPKKLFFIVQVGTLYPTDEPVQVPPKAHA
jgi:hypothetical protein